MLYPSCPTCHTILADKQLIYEEALAKICNENISEDKKSEKKEKLLNTIGLEKICCRMRMISYIDQVKLIV